MTTEQGTGPEPTPPYPPIGSYALLSDCHSSALVSLDGSIDWCCFHRFDSRPVFVRILDWSKGGHFRVAPAEEARVTRRYLPGTKVLETRFESRSGVVVVTDWFALVPGEEGRAVQRHPRHQLVREVRCEGGEVPVRVEFRPRFDYALTVPRLERRGPELFVVYGGADALVLQTSFPLEQVGPCTAEGTVRLREGDRSILVLTYSLPHELDPRAVPRDEIDRRFRETVAMWTEWADRCEYEGPYREKVVRSALVLKALTNAPTGAIVAAPTTSLPEEIGGERNWDYRYTWIRDAAYTIYALFSLGYREEAHRFMHWLERTVAGQAEDLQIMYAVAGERQLHEIELEHLEGYRGSRPVRIGNGAAGQFQLDVYGEVLDTGWQYLQHGGEIEKGYWELCVGAVEFVAEHWERPDAGIWETRGGPQQFVYSKVMAWVAVDRGIRLAEALGWKGDLERWRALRERIRERIESDGVDPGTGAFTQSFGSSIQDAANLRIPVVRFLPAEDPRVEATRKRIEVELIRDGFVHRYRGYRDGLEGEEAAFVICGFWMVDNLAMAGELEKARELFQRLCDSANDVGLLAEEVDPRTGELLGNFPQAFSHIGLINAAVNIARAEHRLSEEAT